MSPFKTVLARSAVVAVAAVIGLPSVAAAWGDDNHHAGRCTGRPFQLVKISDLDGGEKARARKVDRNDNNWVCRKDIPGRGGGNTGENSNIKDDKHGA
ncbi:MAG: hypothetical protein AB1679_04430 [Actinomycetota bacterium]